MGFTTTTLDVATRDEAKAWIIRNQLGRRNLTPYQRAELALALKPLVAEKARERKIASQNNDSAKAVRENLPEQGKGRARNEIAKAAGVSGRTIDKVERIARDAVPELRAAASRGEVSIDAAARVATLPWPGGFGPWAFFPERGKGPVVQRPWLTRLYAAEQIQQNPLTPRPLQGYPEGA